MTAALHCYLVTHPNAICEKNNRAYIVDYINRFNVTDKRTKSENGVTKVEQFNYPGRAEFGVANILPFFDFKMGFAF